MWESFRRPASVCLLACAAAGGYSGEPAPALEPAGTGAPVPGPGGGAPATYRGSHLREVRHLLDHVAQWRTPRDARTDGGVPPAVPVGQGCVRDTYVAAAVQYAWAAESYYRLHHPSAASMAVVVRGDLDRADQLCAGAAREGPDRCRTLEIWGCPAPL